MMLAIAVLILGCFLTYYQVCSSEQDQLIASLRKSIKKQSKSPPATTEVSNERNNPDFALQLAHQYLTLGIALQQKDINEHKGDKTQKEALEAFNQVSSITNKVKDKSGNEQYKTKSVALQILSLFHKGVLLKMMGRGNDSVDAFDSILHFSLCKADMASILYYKADSLLMINQLDLAVNHYQASIQLLPCRADRYYGYVQALKELKVYSKAQWQQLLTNMITIHNQCKKISDNDIDDDNDYMEELAEMLTITGETDMNPDANNKVTSLQPYHLPNGNTFHSLCLLNEDTSSESKGSHNNGVRTTDIYYAISLVAHESQNYQVSWEYLLKANTLEKHRRPLKFDSTPAIQQINHTQAIFTEAFFDSFPHVDYQQQSKSRKYKKKTSPKKTKLSSDTDSSELPQPVFIVGMMRSGSTLLESMLDSHSAIYGIGEESIFNAELNTYRNQIVAASTTQQLEQHSFEYGIQVMKGMLKKVRPSNTSSLSSDDVKYVVDKMLFNYRNIAFIHMVFPDALIINLVRDPLDTLYSCFRHKFDDRGLEWSLDISHLVLQYVLYLQYLQHYRDILPGRVIDIRYAELVYNPEEVLRDIIVKRLHLPWEEKVLRYYENHRAILTNSQSQVRQQLYTHSLGSWKKYQQQLQPMIAEFKAYLPYLERLDALPFKDKINWYMDEEFTETL